MPYGSFLAASFWNSCTQNLFMVDFISPNSTNSIWRYVYKMGQFYGCYIIGEVNPSFIIPVIGDNNNQFVFSLEGFVKLIYWDQFSPMASVIRTLFNVFGYLNYAPTDVK